MTTNLELQIDEADALAKTILRVTNQSIEAGEIKIEDAGVAYLAVAVRLLASCSPNETVVNILRANAEIVEHLIPDVPGTELN
jgi:hypothetical protein